MMSVPSHSGNSLSKGSCCGGYNYHNEDTIWSMFATGYPKHKLISVQPIQVHSNQSWRGIGNGTVTILFGDCSFNGGISLTAISPNGDLFETAANSGKNSFCEVQVEDTGTWFLSGWEIVLLGEVIAPPESVLFGLLKSVPGSFPHLLSFDLSNNLLGHENCTAPIESSILVTNSNLPFVFSFRIPAIEAGAGYLPFDISSFQKLIISTGANFTVTDILLTGSNWMVEITGILNQPLDFVQFEFWEYLGFGATNMLGSDVTMNNASVEVSPGEFQSIAFDVTAPDEITTGGIPALLMERIATVRIQYIGTPTAGFTSTFNGNNFVSNSITIPLTLLAECDLSITGNIAVDKQFELKTENPI